MRTLGTVLVVGLSLFGCVAPDEGSVTFALKDKDLGITTIKIDHDDTKLGRLMTITGYDDHGGLVARATVRTGIVFDMELAHPTEDDGREGRELIVDVREERAEIVILNRSPEVRDTITVAPIRAFLGLDVVAAAIAEEGLLTFKDPEERFERGYNTGCSASRFPFYKPATSSCCEYSNAHDQKIMEGNNVGKIGHRQYGTACTLMNGSTACSGNTCTFGPCGTMSPTAFGTPAGVIFDPTDYAPNPALCGTDTNGTDAGGGNPLDYSGMNPPHPVFPGPLASCQYLSCSNGGFQVATRTLSVHPGSSGGANGVVTTNAPTTQDPNVNLNIASGGAPGLAFFTQNLPVVMTFTPTGPHAFARLDGPCFIVGSPGVPVTCPVTMTTDISFEMKFYCEPGFTCP